MGIEGIQELTASQSRWVRVPTPFKVEGNVLLMEFIGENGEPAPLLRETPLNHPARIYDKIAEAVRRLYQNAELVHGDLSEYNIMMEGLQPVLIDFGQAVSVEHPMAQTLPGKRFEPTQPLLCENRRNSGSAG